MHLSRSSRFLVVCLALAPLTGCMTLKKIFRPEQARNEEYDAKRRADVNKYPDGECGTAEMCKHRCEISERALDCYKTGKAALGGVDVHYDSSLRAEKVSGSTDDINVKYEEESEESMSLMPLARESFERACTASHAESCRISGDLVAEQPAVAASFYRKACDLKDEPACAKISGAK